ncbi:MAG: cytochrome c, partial [Acidobacteriia bacterium]|nr:cytochrome c [Terriglobia bacterium]
MIAIVKGRSSCVFLLAAVAAVAVACVLVVVPLRAQGGGGNFIPGDPKAGMRSFFDKGCARCHSALGEGGHSAPDLARAPAGHLS